MSEKADKIIKRLEKHYTWEEIYNKVNMSIQQKIPNPSETKEFMYMYKWIEKNVPELTNVLDVGCGGGHLSYLLHKKSCNVTGIDISDSAISFCKKELPSCKFIKGDAEDLSMFKDDEFEYVVSNETLEHLKNPDKAFKEFVRVAKIAVLITIPINKHLDNHGTSLHLNHWGFYELMHFLDNYGDNYKICWINKWNRRDPETGAMTNKNLFGVIFKK